MHVTLRPPDWRERGQALVELAVLLPVLMIMLVGIIDLGRVFYHSVVIANAARDGARAGGGDYTLTSGQVCNTVIAAAPPGLVTNCTVAPGARVSGGDIFVTAQYRFVPITPMLSNWIGGGSLPLTQTAQMVVM